MATHDPSVARLQPYIYTILSAPDVDLASISAKRVRKQLVEDGSAEAEFVKERKADIDALIADVFQRVSAERNFAPDDADEPEQEPVPAPVPGGKRRRAASDDAEDGARSRKRAATTDDDEAYAKRLQAELNASKRTSRSGSAGAARGGKANGATAKRGRKAKSAETVDDDDDDGDDAPKKKRKAGGGFQKPYQLSEPLVAVLNQTDYIKENNLQNPSDKREILCDEKLRAVFKLDKVTMFSMNKELSKCVPDTL
ncbi:hypothetical protein K488DRAFT_77098 [Vararia minispora EC-137]|uniref:Uncharacterized protein n=1 Tax=Vararia minispora EC-137 TaxID=1314806 RepID=A0ACB8QTD7_9AGAM|nr:hypothetical protein K488DRAFT_77098 [Vararia minispora EC-137]